MVLVDPNLWWFYLQPPRMFPQMNQYILHKLVPCQKEIWRTGDKEGLQHLQSQHLEEQGPKKRCVWIQANRRVQSCYDIVLARVQKRLMKWFQNQRQKWFSYCQVSWTLSIGIRVRFSNMSLSKFQTPQYLNVSKIRLSEFFYRILDVI